MNSQTLLNGLMLAFLAYAGFGSLNTCRLIHKNHCFFKNKFLLPGNCKPETCLDEADYLAYYFPRLLIFAVSCIVFFVALALIQILQPAIPLWLYAIVSFLPLVPFVFLIIVQNRAAKLFW